MSLAEELLHPLHLRLHRGDRLLLLACSGHLLLEEPILTDPNDAHASPGDGLADIDAIDAGVMNYLDDGSNITGPPLFALDSLCGGEGEEGAGEEGQGGAGASHACCKQSRSPKLRVDFKSPSPRR